MLQVLTILVGLVRAKTLALLLGPAEFGIVSTIDQIMVMVLTLGALGTPFSALKFIAHARSEGDEAFRRTGSGFLRLMLALGVLTTLSASAVAGWRPQLFSSDLAPYQSALRLAILGVPSALLLMLFVNALAAARRAVDAATMTLLATAILAGSAVGGAWWRGVGGLYELSVVAAVLTTAGGLVYLARVLGIKLNAPHTGIVASLRRQPAIVGSSLSFYVTFAAMSIMMLLARTTVLSRLGAASVGHMHAAFSIALTVGAVLYPLSTLYLGPLVNSSGAASEKARVTDAYVGKMLLLLLVGALPPLMFPATLVGFLYSGAFVPVAAVLWLFVLWQCVFQLAYVYHLLLIGLDDMLFAATALVSGCIVVMGLAEVLTSRIGLGGVPLALTVGMALWGAAVTARLRLRHRIGASRRVLVRIASVVLMVALSGYGFAGHIETGLSPILARVVTATLWLSVLWLLMDPQERHPKLWFAALTGGLSAGESQERPAESTDERP